MRRNNNEIRNTILPLGALLFGIGILVVGNGLLGTLIAVRADIEGFTEEAIGAVMASYFVGLMAGCVYGVQLVERVGHIRAFAGLAAIGSASALAYLLLVSPASWAALRAATGFCLAGLYMVTESWLNEQAKPESRGRILSIYMIVNLGALAGGQLLLPLDDPAGFRLFCLASILFSLGLVPVALTRTAAPAPTAVQFMSPARLYVLSPLGTMTCLVSGLTMGAFWGVGPLFARDIGLDPSGIAWFMGATILGGLALQWPAGWLSDRFDRRIVMTCICMIGIVVSVAWLIVPAWSLTLVLLLSCLFGGMIFPLYSIGVAQVNDYVETQDFVGASSALLLVYGTGAALGSIVAGTIMGQIGAPGFFIFQAAVLLALTLLALYRMCVRPALPAEQQGPVVILPRTTPAVFELDPRATPMQGNEKR